MEKPALLCDEHVDTVLVSILRNSGYDVETVEEDLGKGLGDEGIKTYLKSTGRVLVTNDRDFLKSPPSTGLLFYHDQDEDSRTLFRAIESVNRHIDPDEITGKVFFIPDGWV